MLREEPASQIVRPAKARVRDKYIASLEERVEQAMYELQAIAGDCKISVTQKSAVCPDSYSIIMDSDAMGEFTASPDFGSGKLIIDCKLRGDFNPKEHREEFAYWQSTEPISELAASYRKFHGMSKGVAWLEALIQEESCYQIARKAANGSYWLEYIETTISIDLPSRRSIEICRSYSRSYHWEWLEDTQEGWLEAKLDAIQEARKNLQDLKQ